MILSRELRGVAKVLALGDCEEALKADGALLVERRARVRLDRDDVMPESEVNREWTG